MISWIVLLPNKDCQKNLKAKREELEISSKGKKANGDSKSNHKEAIDGLVAACEDLFAKAFSYSEQKKCIIAELLKKITQLNQSTSLTYDSFDRYIKLRKKEEGDYTESKRNMDDDYCCFLLI